MNSGMKKMLLLFNFHEIDMCIYMWYQSFSWSIMVGPGWMGMLQNGIRSRRNVQEVTFPNLLVARDVRKRY
jgi:hypothetical protein